MAKGFRFNIENEENTTPETNANNRELTTFQKVVLTSAGVGVIAGAALITMKAADHAGGEIAKGVTAAKAAKARRDSKKAAKVQQNQKLVGVLKEQGYSEDDIAAVLAAM